MNFKIVLIVLITLTISSCSALSTLSSIPNPLGADKGINTNVALGKDVSADNTKSLINVKGVDRSQQETTTNQNANQITINNSSLDKRMLLLVGGLITLIVLLAGMAIPTRGQANRIRELKENLEYERARTNLTVEAATSYRQETRPPTQL